VSRAIRITVKLFGAYRDAVGAETLTRELAPGSPLDGLWADLCRQWPALAPLAAARLAAVNLDYADGSARLADGDEVAFFPPVSGG
jgi:molybdopterin converting factor small subunit